MAPVCRRWSLLCVSDDAHGGCGSRSALDLGLDRWLLSAGAGHCSVFLTTRMVVVALAARWTWAWIDGSCLPALVTALCF